MVGRGYGQLIEENMDIISLMKNVDIISLLKNKDSSTKACPLSCLILCF